MKRLDNLMPSAMEIVKLHLVENEKVNRTLRNYLDALAVAVYQTGTRPALFFFAQKSKPVMNAVAAMLPLMGFNPASGEKLPEFSLTVTQADAGRFKRAIADACVALKLAMRTFTIDDTPMKEVNHD
jgi:hypothetical protein